MSLTYKSCACFMEQALVCALVYFITLFPKQHHGFHQEVEYKIHHSIMNPCRILPMCQALCRVFCVPCFISCISPTSCYLYMPKYNYYYYLKENERLHYYYITNPTFLGIVSEDILILNCLIRHPVPFQVNP
jgi:hypothetical protein